MCKRKFGYTKVFVKDRIEKKTMKPEEERNLVRKKPIRDECQLRGHLLHFDVVIDFTIIPKSIVLASLHFFLYILSSYNFLYIFSSQFFNIIFTFKINLLYDSQWLNFLFTR